MSSRNIKPSQNEAGPTANSAPQPAALAPGGTEQNQPELAMNQTAEPELRDRPQREHNLPSFHLWNDHILSISVDYAYTDFRLIPNTYKVDIENEYADQ